MHLVRAIQAHEKAAWIDQFGRHPGAALPLPVVPRRQFDKLILIHGDRALGFDVDRIEQVNRKVVVGSRGQIVIKARCRVHIKRGPLRTGKATIRGFQGIRYAPRWSDVVR